MALPVGWEETASKYVIKADQLLPVFRIQDMKLIMKRYLDSQTLVISGQRKMSEPEVEETDAGHRVERKSGSFFYVKIRFSEDAGASHAGRAYVKDGVLTVEVLKKPEARRVVIVEEEAPAMPAPAQQ